jgi:hypothetical protein
LLPALSVLPFPRYSEEGGSYVFVGFSFIQGKQQNAVTSSSMRLRAGRFLTTGQSILGEPYFACAMRKQLCPLCPNATQTGNSTDQNVNGYQPKFFMHRSASNSLTTYLIQLVHQIHLSILSTTMASSIINEKN